MTSFIPKMPLALQRRLLTSYFNSFKNRFEFSEDKFLSFISRFDKRISVTKYGYFTIFNKIVNEKITDLEAIFSEDSYDSQGFEDSFSKMIPSHKAINDREKVDQTERKFEFDPLPLNQRTYDLTRAYLFGNLKLDSKNRQLLTEFFERLLNNQPSTLRKLINESIFDNPTENSYRT